jgi:DNA-3-methyladenine glycosylase I
VGELSRCGWATSAPEYVAYHDDEWGRPLRGVTAMFERLSLEGFQSGLSWLVILRKRPAFRTAFAGFKPAAVARFDDADVARLLADAGIVRNRRKIEATIDNAVEMQALAEEHGDFRKYLRSHGGFEETVADLRSHFRFLGDFGAYYFLHVVSEPVPPHDEWQASRGKSKR